MLRILLLSAGLFLTGCSIYKLDIPQGNIITQEMASKLKTGQTREQVRFILGTPLAADPFHAQRWDYVWHIERGDKVLEDRKFTVFFNAINTLERWEGETAPSAITTQPRN